MTALPGGAGDFLLHKHCKCRRLGRAQSKDSRMHQVSCCFAACGAEPHVSKVDCWQLLAVVVGTAAAAAALPLNPTRSQNKSCPRSWRMLCCWAVSWREARCSQHRALAERKSVLLQIAKATAGGVLSSGDHRQQQTTVATRIGKCLCCAGLQTPGRHSSQKEKKT